MHFRMQFYTPEELTQIVDQASHKLEKPSRTSDKN